MPPAIQPWKGSSRLLKRLGHLSPHLSSAACAGPADVCMEGRGEPGPRTTCAPREMMLKLSLEDFGESSKR